jgi:serine/threonine protein kinase
MEGYNLLEDGGRQPTTISRAVNHGHVVILKLIPCNTNELTILEPNELKLLEHLQTLHSHQNHTIKLLHVIHSDHMADLIVMPWQLPLNEFLCHHSSLRMVESLRDQIVEGIWFLHQHLIAHLDLKPENVLVSYTDSSSLAHLSIGDYSTSICVESEESEVVGYRRTPFWSAPNVGVEDGPELKYSVIRADRWSCGPIIHYLAQFHPLNDGSVFGSTYEQLLRVDPSSRPSLVKVLDGLHVAGTHGRYCKAQRWYG